LVTLERARVLLPSLPLLFSAEVIFAMMTTAAPLSLDVLDDHIVVGLADGRIQIYSIRLKRCLMEFTAHKSQVRLLFVL